MDRTAVLCSKDRMLLNEFSRRIKLISTLILLPPLNIAKEIFADMLLNVMERIRLVVSVEFAGMVYGGSCSSRN